MIIGKVKLAYPCVRFKVHVAHFTARDSTAIEWMILEAIDRCARFPAYGDWPVGTLFHEIFMVADPNQIILPCLLTLQDLSAITAGGISDETDLDSVYMRNLRLTAAGAEMQRTGKLPGKTDYDLFEVDYDPIKERLITVSKGKMSEEPDGIPVIEIGSAEEIGFPSAQIRNMLEVEQKSHPKGDDRFTWLLASTQIESMDQAGATLSWYSVEKDVLLGPGMECWIDGEENPELNGLVLKAMDFDTPEGMENLPVITADDPDSELGEIVRYRCLDPLVRERMGVDFLAITRKEYVGDEIAGQIRKDKRLHVLVVEGCEQISAVLRNRQLVIKLPEQFLPDNIIYTSSESRISAGRCVMRAGKSEREVAIGYLLQESGSNLGDLIADAVVWHAKEAPLALLALYAMDRKDDFMDRVCALCGTRGSIEEKNRLLQEFNQAGLMAFGKRCVPQDAIARILVDPEYIRAGCIDIDGALKTLSEYETVTDIRQCDEVYRDILRQILSQLQPADSLEELYRLWGHIAGVKQSHMRWVNQNGFFRTLYSKDVMDVLMNIFPDDDFYSLVRDEYTPVEQTLAAMRRAVGDIIELMPELEDAQDNESVKEAVLAHDKDMRRFQGDIRSWRDALERFEERVGDRDEYIHPGSGTAAMVDLMDRVADALALFLEDSAIEYASVVVADTCALMNHPELISWFDDGKAMLIIPQTVLCELDAKKISKDEEEASQARMAIRQIDIYRSYSWLNLSEVSDPSLLNRDLNPASSDNRILSVALRYIVKSPILLTDDINFRNIANAQPGISAMDANAYEMRKKYETENAAKQRGKHDKKGKKQGRKKK